MLDDLTDRPEVSRAHHDATYQPLPLLKSPIKSSTAQGRSRRPWPESIGWGNHHCLHYCLVRERTFLGAF